MWADSWEETALADLTSTDIFVIVGTTDAGSFSMSNNNGTGNAPAAAAVTIVNGKITSTVSDVIQWKLSGNSTDGYTFYPNGSTTTWLYCNTTAVSSSNNNMRVGTGNRKVFVLDNNNHLLTKTMKDNNNNDLVNRYVCVYNGADWRGYTSASPATTLKFYKKVAGSVANPTFSPVEGTYINTQNVTISCTTDGATIRYTTDGSDPTNTSTIFSTTPISVSSTTTIKAKAFKNSDESSVASATYSFVSLNHAGTQADPYTVADARKAIDALDGNKTGVYVTGIVCTGGTSLDNGKMNYYISDDGTETNKFQIYKGKGINGADFTATSEVQVGDVVVVTGNIKKYNTTYEIDEDNQLVSIKKKPADPVISPAAGNVAVGTQVTITCATDGATIYYTTNGDDPTDGSTAYTGPITVNSDVTIKAIAYNQGLTSAIVSATYTAFANSYTVTLGDDSSDLTESSPGAGVTLPTRDDSGSYEFVGWSETNVTSETNIKPTIIPAGAYNPTQNVTLYPVYARPNYSAESKTGTVTVSTYATANNWNNGTKYTTVNIDNNITAIATGGGNTGKYYTNGNDWRFYQNESAKVTITAEKGHALKTVKFTFTVSNTGTLTYNDAVLVSETPVNVSGSSAEFVVKNSGEVTNGQVKITAIEVVYTDASYLSSPEKVTISSYEWATFVSDKALDFTGLDVKAYAVEGRNGSSLILSSALTAVPAYTPLLLNAPEGSYNVPVVASASAIGTNLLKAGTGEKVNPIGGKTRYVLGVEGGVATFLWIDGTHDAIVPTNKAYLEFDEEINGAPVLSLDSNTTGISTLNVERETLNNNSYYMLDGRRVAQPTKGLYIVNGKKVIIK